MAGLSGGSRPAAVAPAYLADGYGCCHSLLLRDGQRSSRPDRAFPLPYVVCRYRDGVGVPVAILDFNIVVFAAHRGFRGGIAPHDSCGGVGRYGLRCWEEITSSFPRFLISDDRYSFSRFVAHRF